MPDFLKPIKYFSDGYTYFVSQGIGGNRDPWFTVRQQEGKAGTHRVCSPNLRLRSKRDDAQTDLNRYAEKHKMTQVKED